MSNIDHVFSVVQAAVSVRNSERSSLDLTVEGWACEKLSDDECDAFFAAVGEGRYIDAHQILSNCGLNWPWRQQQFDRWLASHSR